MNRAQAKDFQTYSALTHSKEEFPDLVPMTDVEELRRMAEASGYGEPIYDDGSDESDEFRETLSELGLDKS